LIAKIYYVNVWNIYLYNHSTLVNQKLRTIKYTTIITPQLGKIKTTYSINMIVHCLFISVCILIYYTNCVFFVWRTILKYVYPDNWKLYTYIRPRYNIFISNNCPKSCWTEKSIGCFKSTTIVGRSSVFWQRSGTDIAKMEWIAA